MNYTTKSNEPCTFNYRQQLIELSMVNFPFLKIYHHNFLEKKNHFLHFRTIVFLETILIAHIKFKDHSLVIFFFWEIIFIIYYAKHLIIFHFLSTLRKLFVEKTLFIEHNKCTS